MAFGNLTTDQQAAILNLANVVRPAAGDIARLMNVARAITSGYVGNVETIIGNLAGVDLIPLGPSGLSEAQPLTKDELVTLVGYFITMSESTQGGSAPTTYNTGFHRSLYAKAAGVTNIA